jgi:hypothetical protein
MDGAEVLAYITSVVVALLGWIALAMRFGSVGSRVRRGPGKRVLALSLLAVLAINVTVLSGYSARDVRGDLIYFSMYLMMGLASSALTVVALRMFGLRISDIVERGNRAAGVLLFCALVSNAFAYAGANIGDGPGFHVVLFSAGLSNGAIFLLAMLHAGIARTMYRILVDRDMGISVQFGCLLIACGLILGRAVAGTWVDTGQTLSDFVAVGWPAAALVVVDALVMRVMLAREPNGSMPADFAIGVTHLGIGAGYVAMLGIPQ